MRDIDLMSPEKVAAEYGGDKRKIAQAAQMGILNPTVAVMAGMFIDRMRGAAAKEQQPTTTVAEEVLSRPQAGLEAARAAPVERGLDALPVPDEAVPSFESGGIVAFAGEDGSFVQSDDMETRRLRELLRRKYAGVASPLGMLTPVPASGVAQFQENRRTVQNLLEALPSLDKEQLKYMLANAPDITNVGPSAAPAQVQRGLGAISPEVANYPDETTRGTAARAAAGIPGKRPQEEYASLMAGAAKPKEEAVAKKEDQTGERIGRPSIAPASFEEALGKAKTSLGGLPKEDVFADIKAELAERKGKSTEDLKQAAYMRLAEFGFGMAAGTSPYAAVNAGKSGIQAIKNYGEDLKEQRKLDRDDRKLLADIRRLEKADARDDVFKTTELAYKIYNEANEDIRNRLASDTNLAIEASRAATARETNVLTRQGLDQQRAFTLANTAEQNIRTSLAKQAENPASPVAKLIKANPNYIEEQAVSARNRVLTDLGITPRSMTQALGGSDSRFKFLGREGA